MREERGGPSRRLLVVFGVRRVVVEDETQLAFLAGHRQGLLRLLQRHLVVPLLALDHALQQRSFRHHPLQLLHVSRGHPPPHRLNPKVLHVVGGGRRLGPPRGSEIDGKFGVVGHHGWPSQLSFLFASFCAPHQVPNPVLGGGLMWVGLGFGHFFFTPLFV